MNPKLEQLGVYLPLFPLTSVGSFPKPDYLKKARTKFVRGEISEEELHSLEKKATDFWIQKQEELEMDILVDGEMYRGDMVTYFAETMKGFGISGLVRSYGNRFYRKPIITEKIEWTSPVTVDWWKYTQAQTKRPVKGVITGAYTIMDWSYNEYYPDRKSACLAIAYEIRKEVEALIEAGAKIIQIDEPALSVRPDELRIAKEAMEISVQGLSAYFITHVCYGDFEKIYPKMLDIPVDNFDLEFSNSNLDMLELVKKYTFTKDVSYGVVDVHTDKIENIELVRNRMNQGLDVFKSEQVWVDPDCGLKTRTVDEAIAKMKVIADVIFELRNSHTGE